MANHGADSLGDQRLLRRRQSLQLRLARRYRPAPRTHRRRNLPTPPSLGWKSEQPHTAFTSRGLRRLEGSEIRRSGPTASPIAPPAIRVKMSERPAHKAAHHSQRHVPSQPGRHPVPSAASIPVTIQPTPWPRDATRRARGEAFVKYLHEKYGNANPYHPHHPRVRPQRPLRLHDRRRILPYIFPKALILCKTAALGAPFIAFSSVAMSGTST